MENIENLKSPPVIGQIYLVPCVLGKLYNIGPHSIPAQWWPVLRPSHEDSKYLPKFRTFWVNGEEIDETYYESDPNTPHHFHVDPRFTPESYYTKWEIDNQSWHNFVSAQSEVEWRELVCIREMPVQQLFTGFGEKFVEDHKDKKIKCGRCPHKGVILSNTPVKDGVITCPAHGLKFDAETGECVTNQQTTA